MSKVKFIENFLSFQGEGPSRGRQMLILRFKRCSRVEAGTPCVFCDTRVKMRISQEAEISYKDIQEVINRTSCGILLTGGEPSFDTQYTETVNLMRKLKFPLADIETNGYKLSSLIQEVTKKNIKFMWSPKIFDQKELEESIKILEEVKDDKRVYIKLVINSLEDKCIEFLDYLSEKKYEILSRTYLMPQGRDRDTIISNSSFVFDLCEKYNVNFSSRDHIIFGFV